MILYLVGAVWGRVLNHLAYIFVHEYAPMTPVSSCSSCHCTFTWYQRIPIISYVLLRGRCPQCCVTIAPYNLLIEILTGLAVCVLYYSQTHTYFFAYFIFFSALLITIRTDLETLLIARVCTTYLIPVGLLLSGLGFLPLSFFESMFGASVGYLLLYGVMKFFTLFTGKQGMGLGDLDLLAFIGAFVGPSGCWLTLLIGSTLGSLVGCLLIVVVRRSKETPIPFGPFLSLGAMAYVVWQEQFLRFLFSL